MEKDRPNIVQVEFFLVNMRGTLENLLTECQERTEDDARIKTVIRFFDKTGTATDFILCVSRIDKKLQKLRDTIAYSKVPWKTIQNMRTIRLMKKRAVLKEKSVQLAVGWIHSAIQNQQPVAIENPDYSFRSVEKNETHELIETTSKSTSVWLFVFEPNFLLSDTNTLIAAVM